MQHATRFPIESNQANLVAYITEHPADIEQAYQLRQTVFSQAFNQQINTNEPR